MIHYRWKDKEMKEDWRKRDMEKPNADSVTYRSTCGAVFRVVSANSGGLRGV